MGDEKMANEKFTVVGTNIQEKATVIWNVADLLRGPFKPHEYGLVILPMTVVKRFHDCLLPTHQAVLDTYEKVKKLAVTDGFLRRACLSRRHLLDILAEQDKRQQNSVGAEVQCEVSFSRECYI